MKITEWFTETRPIFVWIAGNIVGYIVFVIMLGIVAMIEFVFNKLAFPGIIWYINSIKKTWNEKIYYLAIIIAIIVPLVITFSFLLILNAFK